MKYLKTYEKLSVEEKKGNKVARKIQHLVNKFTSIKDEDIIKVSHPYYWGVFKYHFQPYVFITIQNYKNIPKILQLIDELVRLNTELAPEKHTTPNNERNKRRFGLTLQQIDEILISFKNGIPKEPIKNINKKDEIYTYVNLHRASENILMNDDIIIGHLFTQYGETTIKGITMRNKEIEVQIYTDWKDHMKYVRIATQEEKNKYNMTIQANKYNL